MSRIETLSPLVEWTGNRRLLLGRAGQLALSVVNSSPVLAASFDFTGRRASNAYDVAQSFINQSASREVSEYIAGMDRITIETDPEMLAVSKNELGQLPCDPTGETIAHGVIPADGDRFLILELEGQEDPLTSSPHFLVTCDSQQFHVGIAQGDESSTAQLALGYLSEGEHVISVEHTDYSRFLNQQDPGVKIIELQANHPLIRDFALPSIPTFYGSFYEDSPSELGFREDGMIGSDWHFFKDDKGFKQILNKWAFKERVGDPHRLWSERDNHDWVQGDGPEDFQGTQDLDALQVGMSDLLGFCSELGIQTDTFILGYPFLSHHLDINQFVPARPLRDMYEFVNEIQATGKHGMGSRKIKGLIGSRDMPEFSGYLWRGKGWKRSVATTSLRQLVLTGALDPTDEIITEFSDRELQGNSDLIRNPKYLSR